MGKQPLQGFRLIVSARLYSLHNARLQPSYLPFDIDPIEVVPRHARRRTRPCCCVHLHFSRLKGSTNSLVMRNHEEVCTISRGVMFQRTTPIRPITGWHSLTPRSCSRAAIGRPCSLLSPQGAIRGFHVPPTEVHRVRCLLSTGRRMGHESVDRKRCSHLRCLLAQA